MTINKQQVKKHLQEFDFPRLFTQELGWDHHKATLTITVNNQEFNLHAAAEKRGMSAFVLEGDIPDYPIRRKIERQVTKSAHEHLIIYVDPDHTTQIWQWVKREPGKPVACREHTYYKGQSGESLVQRLELLLVTLEEEPDITTLDIANRARDAFNVDRVTKRFFDLFKNEHKDFLDFIKGIPDDEMQRWYASVMLNRLMFVYFIQKKGFLDGNPHYLKDKLEGFVAKGTDKYYSEFLCPLFFAGFAIKEEDRSAKTNKLLGKVPYLNGGIFQKHQIEQLHGKDIQIPDRAFTALFDFFERYQWHLDERPLRADNEINPDVLGYIFEKYINQKQMGAYYTKEDITGYISKNTIIPFLFDAARKKCKIAFEGDQSIWNLLTSDPDRYFYPAVKHGTDKELPEDIAAGIEDVPKRTNWNKLAPDDYGLPTEIWREVVARRQRYEEIRSKLANGEVRDINDLITYNLDICQFAQDVVENCEGPELLRAIWKAIEKITVLDPTCGSGAFLFAALNILEPLYEACLDRMQVFLDELERSGEKHRPEKFSDFRKILKRIDEHPNRRYFILKSIILNNLYGVDIMDEAIEICKLRLFLKMVAQIENLDDLEPLPDIDFNIRAGNTLVGYASFDEVQRAAESDLIKQQSLPAIKEKAELASKAFELFHKMQTDDGSSASQFADAKKELQERLSVLELELNKFLADEYHANTSANPKKLKSWIKSHKPFHWCIDFYRIIWNGGFYVVIGNPPYVEYTRIRSEYRLLNYQTISCGNLYAYVTERSISVLSHYGRTGMIVQLPIVCTDRMKPLQDICLHTLDNAWYANFDDRPARLFDGLEHIRATVFTARKGIVESSHVFSTNYLRWYSQCRKHLFSSLEFSQVNCDLVSAAIPKIGHDTPNRIAELLKPFTKLGVSKSRQGKHVIYFHNAPQYWIRAMDFAPYFWNERDGEHTSRQVKQLRFATKPDSLVSAAVLNSSLFYWWFIVLSDCRHLNLREIDNLPLGLSDMEESLRRQLEALNSKLMVDFQRHAERKNTQYKTTGQVSYDEYYPRKSKHIIDAIDSVLAVHYGFSQEELDYIVSYDIKYRMGLNSQREDN